MDKSFTDSSDLFPEVRLEFSHLYKVEILQELPNTREELHYFPVVRQHGRDGVLLKVSPDCAVAWNALFASQPSGNYKNGVYSCPDSNSLCVIANGSGYVLDVRNPDNYEEISISPIVDVAFGTEAGILAFANYTDVLAWSSSGFLWLTERVSFDGIRNLRVEKGALRGLAWSPIEGEHPFALNLTSGRRISAE